MVNIQHIMLLLKLKLLHNTLAKHCAVGRWRCLHQPAVAHGRVNTWRDVSRALIRPGLTTGCSQNTAVYHSVTFGACIRIIYCVFVDACIATLLSHSDDLYQLAYSRLFVHLSFRCTRLQDWSNVKFRSWAKTNAVGAIWSRSFTLQNETFRAVFRQYVNLGHAVLMRVNL